MIEEYSDEGLGGFSLSAIIAIDVVSVFSPVPA